MKVFSLRGRTVSFSVTRGLSPCVDRTMHKLSKAPLALNGLGRCFITEKHVSMVQNLRRGFLCTEQGKDEVYDVIISGGGMVGSAMACSLGECCL